MPEPPVPAKLQIGDKLQDQFGIPLVVIGFRDHGDELLEMVMLRCAWTTRRPEGRLHPEYGMSTRQVLAQLASGRMKRRSV